MKAAVPRQIVDSGRGFEEDNGSARRSGRLMGNTFGNTCDLEVIQPADESAFDALSEEFRKLIHEVRISNQVYSRYYTGKP